MNTRSSAAVAAAAVLCSASPAAGQACMGVPTRDAEFTIRAEMALPDDARQYSAVVNADLIGPLSFELNGGVIDIDDVEDRGASFGGKAGYALDLVPALSICPLAGAQYSTLEAEEFKFVPLTVEASTLVLSAGVGFGTTVGDVPGITLFAQPQYLYIRSTFDDGIRPEEETGTTSELGIDAGARLSLGRLLLGGGVTWTTIARADPVLSVTAGVTF